MFPFQRASLDSSGLTLSRKGRIAFEDIASYDTDAVDFGMKGRLYLHIRPKKGLSYRLIPHPRDREVFYELCLAFKRYADARITNGPTQKSFWGSPAARAFGVIGLLIEAIVTAMVLSLAPHMLGYVAFLLLVGTPMFVWVILGKRAN
ncbi:MAG: hypothetical protein CMN27_13790 [Salinisphaera sp.]|nr:hypothetical protein [Salinisphaera sp.]